jgi:protein-disulfide isomerase
MDDGLTVDNTCFRRLAFRSAVTSKTVELFLSPDQRFVSESLLDTTRDPEEERRRISQATQRALLADASPTKGLPDAAVTVVVFSDFQCIYCKKLAEFWSHLSPADTQMARLVFKQHPLPMHNWARPAALATICASGQGDVVFWELHELLFANQSTLTPETINNVIEEHLMQKPNVDIGEYRRCIHENVGEAVLLRDEALANTYHVEATPTVFVNGIRRIGFASAQELRLAIRAATAKWKAAPSAGW